MADSATFDPVKARKLTMGATFARFERQRAAVWRAEAERLRKSAAFCEGEAARAEAAAIEYERVP